MLGLEFVVNVRTLISRFNLIKFLDCSIFQFLSYGKQTSLKTLLNITPAVLFMIHYWQNQVQIYITFFFGEIQKHSFPWNLNNCNMIKEYTYQVMQAKYQPRKLPCSVQVIIDNVYCHNNIYPQIPHEYKISGLSEQRPCTFKTWTKQVMFSDVGIRSSHHWDCWLCKETWSVISTDLTRYVNSSRQIPFYSIGFVFFITFASENCITLITCKFQENHLSTPKSLSSHSSAPKSSRRAMSKVL